MPRLAGVAIPLMLVHVLALQRVTAQGYAPQRAASAMTVADGFRVELVAAEPLVRQPVAIEFDDRGRLWVIQYLQYPNPAGLKRVAVDRYSRTEYDRVPEPPPRGPRGADRITILADRDGDGRLEHGKDFVDGLNLATGLAFGYGGVFVLNVPYLLFYPDRDRDDVPDGNPEVLLTGFGMHDAHSVANSLTWGPDGWLYGCQGSTVTADIRGIQFQQGVWRYHPRTKQFELFCEGGGNSWGLDFDADGNLIYSTNVGGHVALHGVQGAYLVKSFGKHGLLHNPYAFGYFEHIPHTGFRGGHVTVGGVFYGGTTFPREFRGSYMAADLLGHGVYWHRLGRDGATFRSDHGGELLVANDTWFAPSDVAVGPSGAVYVADWHDQRTAHPDPDASWDRSNGRIFRIQAEGAEAQAVVDLNERTSWELVDWLDDRNAWYVRRANRILAERRDERATAELRRIATESSNERLALQAVWALHGSAGIDDATAAKLLEHRDENIRKWVVRLLGDRRAVSANVAQKLVQMARTDPSVRVRAQLACTAKRLPTPDAIPIVAELFRRDADARDRYVPLLVWWAVEAHAVDAMQRMLDAVETAGGWQRPLLRDVVLQRLMRRYAAAGTPRALTACARLLSSAPDEPERGRMLAALDDGLAQIRAEYSTGFRQGTLFSRFAERRAGENEQPPDTYRLTEIPAQLADLLAQLRQENPSDATLLRIAMRLRNRIAQQRVVELASDGSVSEKRRLAMLAVLEELGDQACVAPLLELVISDEPEAVRRSAMKVLQRFGRPQTATTILSRYASMSDSLRSAARSLLFSRREWARMFLQRVDRGVFAADEVSVNELRQVAQFADEGMNDIVRKHWGEIRPGSPEEKLAEMRRLNNDLRAGPGNADAGQPLFKKHCATCHKLFGEGSQVGPDLTHANRQDREFLLASLVDPSAQIRKEFLSYVVQTANGRALTGVIVEQTPNAITLLDAKNQRTTIGRNEIELLQESNVSLMPDNVLELLSPQQLRDLFAYLQKS